MDEPLRGAERCILIMMHGEIVQVSVAPNGGVPKLPVDRAEVTELGLVGDDQADKKHHGGPTRAVCLFSAELIETLRGEGHPIGPGTVGENLTVSGLDWSVLAPGMRIRIEGDAPVELEVTSYTEPCSTIRDSFSDLNSKRIKQDLHPGESRLYAKVVQAGWVATGDRVVVEGA